jgi:hypothetical protein
MYAHAPAGRGGRTMSPPGSSYYAHSPRSSRDDSELMVSGTIDSELPSERTNLDGSA